jgi:hypothetical protein
MALLRAILVGALAFVLLLAGCGDGDSDTTVISKRTLVREANASCKKDNEKISAAFEKFGAQPRSEEVEFVVRTVLPIREEQLRRLKELGPPSEGAKRYRDLLAAMEEGIQRGKREPASLVGLAERYAFWDALKLGLAFGLERCWLN